jgi:hypothetical protein
MLGLPPSHLLHDSLDLALVVALVAFGFDLFHSHLLKKRIEALAKSMSTRFIGRFPKNFHEIIDTISRTDRELLVLVDLLGYCCYSKPVEFDEYVGKLERLRADKGAAIKILVYNETLGDQQLRQQFLESDFSAETGCPRFKKFFQMFPPEPRSYGDFLDRLKAHEANNIEQARKRGIEIRQLSVSAFMFFWLEDDEDSVFAFDNTGGDERSLSFRTRDPRLIETFRTTFDQHWK